MSEDNGFIDMNNINNSARMSFQYLHPELLIKEKSDNRQDLKLLKNDVLTALAANKRQSATEMMVKDFLDNNYIYTTRDDQKPEMWIYSDGIYVPQGKSFIREYVRELLGEAYTTHLCNEVLAKIEADTYIDHDLFFKNNYKDEIPVLNGILNIFTRELKAFTPDKVFFNKCPVKYDPAKDCIAIDCFLNDVLSNPEDKAVFYEIGGFSLLKEYTYEKAFMFIGTGRNGKGKTIELLKRLIGSDNCCSLPLNKIVSDNFSVSELYGKLLNLAGDISNQDLRDTALFKAATGRDMLGAKRKYLNEINFENYAKFVFACNELPMVYDLSKGYWDRWVLLEFPYYFADKTEFEKAKDEEKLNWKIKDENIINEITTPDELSGLLNKFLDGLERLRNNHKFSTTRGSDDVKNMWIRKSNSFMAFMMDHIENEPDGKISKKELRQAYAKYCKKHKVASKSDLVIKKSLQETYGVIESFNDLGLGYQEHCWIGIKWKEAQNELNN